MIAALRSELSDLLERPSDVRYFAERNFSCAHTALWPGTASSLSSEPTPMPQGSIVNRDGVRVIQGTPTSPLQAPTLFLRLWRIAPPGEKPRTLAALAMARPARSGYVVKDLIADMELGPKEALDKAVAIAKRGDVAEVYVNADLAKLPRHSLVAAG